MCREDEDQAQRAANLIELGLITHDLDLQERIEEMLIQQQGLQQAQNARRRWRRQFGYNELEHNDLLEPAKPFEVPQALRCLVCEEDQATRVSPDRRIIACDECSRQWTRHNPLHDKWHEILIRKSEAELESAAGEDALTAEIPKEEGCDPEHAMTRQEGQDGIPDTITDTPAEDTHKHEIPWEEADKVVMATSEPDSKN
jgi:hypothetical protein